MTRIEAQGPAMGLFRDPHVARLTDQVPLLSRQVQRLHQLIERLAARQGITPPPPVVAGPLPFVGSDAPGGAGDGGQGPRRELVGQATTR